MHSQAVKQGYLVKHRFAENGAVSATLLGRVRANCVDVVHSYMAVARFPKVSSIALPILLSSSSKRWKPVTELQVRCVNGNRTDKKYRLLQLQSRNTEPHSNTRISQRRGAVVCGMSRVSGLYSGHTTSSGVSARPGLCCGCLLLSVEGTGALDHPCGSDRCASDGKNVTYWQSASVLEIPKD